MATGSQCEATYAERCQVVADAAQKAGLPVRGLLYEDLGFRPGVLLDVKFDSPKVEAFARDNGYNVAPSQLAGSPAIVEMPGRTSDNETP